MRNFLSVIWLFAFILVDYFSRNFLSCQYRIPITYFITAFTVYSLVVLQYWIPTQYINRISKSYWPILIVSIISLIGLNFVSINSITQIILFALFVTSLAFLISPLYYLGQQYGILGPCLMSVIALTLCLSFISYIKPELVSFSWRNVLWFSLIGLIILRISFLIFPKIASNQMVRLAGYFGIVLFSAYILYDTKLMRWRAEQCNRPYNYIKNIVSLFLDFINLFTNSLSVGISNRQ